MGSVSRTKQERDFVNVSSRPGWGQTEEPWKVTKHVLYQAGGDGKQACEVLLVAGLVLWWGSAAALVPTRAICGPGGEGVMENRAESPHPSGHRDTLYVLRVSCMLMFGSLHILYYSWLEAIAIWLKKTLWMNPALVYTLWIAVPLYCLHLSSRDLNEANVFCMLEWHVLMETVKGHVGSSGGIGKLARHWRNIRWYHVSRATVFLNHYSKPSQY